MIEIVTIGAEVLSGYTINTNAAFLGKTLSEMGYQVLRETTIPDTEDTIKETLLTALTRSTLTLVTGGLGITTDDLTKTVIDHLFQKTTPVPNTLGNAPGRIFEKEGRFIVFLPGVPREMKEMFSKEIVPKIPVWLRKEPVFKTHTLTLLSLKEKEINDQFTKWQNEFPHVQIGIYPSLGFLTIRLKSLEEPKKLIDQIKERFKSQVLIGKTLDSALHNLLIQKNLTLSVAESCTGGALSYRFTSQSGSSHYFLGSVVSYSNSIKENLLNVSPQTLKNHGAVSEETVKEMCTHIQKLMNSRIAFAVSGIAGPTGGTEEKPIGTVYIGLKIDNFPPEIKRLNLKGSREMIVTESINTLLSQAFIKLSN